MLGGQQLEFLLVGQLAHRADFLRRDGERLLADHVLAGSECSQHRRRMHLVRRADVYRIEVEFHEVAVIAEDMLGVQFLGDFLGELEVHVAHGNDLHIRQRLPAGHMRPAKNTARPNCSNSKLPHLVVSFGYR